MHYMCISDLNVQKQSYWLKYLILLQLSTLVKFLFLSLISMNSFEAILLKMRII